MTVRLLFGGLAVVLLLDALRRFTATSAIALTGSLPPVAVASFVLIPFVLSAPAVAALSRVAPRSAVLVSGGTLVASTLLAPFLGDLRGVLAAAAAGCVAGATLLALIASTGRPGETPDLPEIVVLGLTLDLVRRLSLGTLDLAEVPGGNGLVVAAALGIAFVGAGAVAVRRTWAWAVRPAGGSLQLAVLPLAFVAAELAATNGWHAAATGGLGLVDAHGLRAFAVGSVGVALGLALGGLAPARGLRMLAVGSLAGAAALEAARLPTVSLAGGTLHAAGLVMSLRLLSGADGRSLLSPARVAAIMTVGWIGFVAITLGYFVTYAAIPTHWAATAALAAIAFVSGARPRAVAWPLRLSAAGAIALALALVVGASGARDVAASGSLRLMTYNIHFGFDHRQTPSLGEIARTIEAESPDVVVLQEVMRGSSLAVQHDALGWLAARLGMTYVFAPTVGDIFGNAVLTRLPIEDQERMSFVRPAPPRHSPRGALLVRAAGVAIIVAHLDEYADAAGAAVREDEVRALLDRWGGTAPPVVIAGDLNAPPESGALELLAAAGFRDLAADAGGTFPVLAPTTRIDYVLARGITATTARVLTSAASDHRAIVVDLVLPRR